MEWKEFFLWVLLILVVGGGATVSVNTLAWTETIKEALPYSQNITRIIMENAYNITYTASHENLQCEAILGHPPREIFRGSCDWMDKNGYGWKNTLARGN